MVREEELKRMFGLALLHPNFDRKIWFKALKQEKVILQNLGCKEARKLYNLHRKIAGYIHKKKSFIRFTISKKGVLYSKVDLKYPIEKNLLIHFHKRFPYFYILIQSRELCWWISPHGKIYTQKGKIKEIIREVEKRIKHNSRIASLEFDEKWWADYYSSQNIKERKNLRLMKQHMPKYAVEKNSTEAKQLLKTASLLEYFG